MENDKDFLTLPSGNGQDDVYYTCSLSRPPLGEGGMGRVYQGQCVSINGEKKDVAIKFMFDDLPVNAIERARLEASIRLHNDHLIEMLDFVEVEETDRFGGMKRHCHIVSELLMGVSLAKLIQGDIHDQRGVEQTRIQEFRQLYQNDRRKFAFDITMAVLSGLMALHDAGYLHRDIDPSNVMLVADGRIKIIDFGLSTTKDRSRQGSNGSQAGQMIAKPVYAAPELITGDLLHQDVTTDTYSVGVMFYELLTGKKLFDMPEHEVIQFKMNGNRPSLDLIHDKRLRNVINKAIQNKQNKRYQTAAEMRADLEKAYTPSSPHPQKLIYSALGFLLTIAAVVLVVFCWPKREDGTKPVPNVSKKVYSLVDAKKMLSADSKTAELGLLILDSLAMNTNDAEASYLLSQLYREETMVKTQFVKMKLNAKVKTDASKSHELLELTLKNNKMHLDACLCMAIDCMQGWGTVQDYETARMLLQRVIDNGTKEQVQQAKIRLLNIPIKQVNKPKSTRKR